MKTNLAFLITFIISETIIIIVSELLFNAINIRVEWIQPIILLWAGLFLAEYFKVKDNQKGLWQIVSSSTRDRLSLILHLTIGTFITGWINQIYPLTIYKLLIWLVLLIITGLSFFLTATPEARPLIKNYFFGK